MNPDVHGTLGRLVRCIPRTGNSHQRRCAHAQRDDSPLEDAGRLCRGESRTRRI